MPIWLRRFTFREINEFYIHEKEEYDKATSGDKITAKTDPRNIKPLPKVEVPNFVSAIKKHKK